MADERDDRLREVRASTVDARGRASHRHRAPARPIWSLGAIAVLVAIVFVGAARAKDFEDFPVWKAMEGLWYGDLSYYSGDGS